MENNGSFLAQFFSTPPITRTMSLAIIVVIVCVYINLLSPYKLMYSPLFLKNGEIWRILTCFLYFGKPSLDVIIHITFLYRYSRMLEEGFIYTSDYFWLVFIISSLLFLISNVISIPLLASAFSSTITYIWTRRNPHALVQIFGFISFPAFYLPFIVPLFMLITEKRILTEDLLGIVVGHVYFFFKDVYPKWGSDVFKTPCAIKKLFGEHSNDCCKKSKYRTLNLNANQPTPTMETIIIEDSIAGEDTCIMAEAVDINLTIEDINEDDSMSEEEQSNGADNSLNLTRITEEVETDHPETSLKVSNKSSIEIGEDRVNEFLEEKSKEEKEWEQTWTSETIEE